MRRAGRADRKGFTKAPIQHDPIHAADDAGSGVAVSPDAGQPSQGESKPWW
jgi:hypothetical protein